MQEFSRLLLSKNLENFHRDVEQAALSAGRLIPSIENSLDPLLQFPMFFYHRIGVNLQQIPVNCPFMAKSYASLTFDGQMRTDAKHAEAPCVVNNNIVSRRSPYWHEGKKNDHEQATQHWSKTMTEQQRKNTSLNTSKYLKFVIYSEIQENYLAQVYNISPDYAQSVYDLLPKPHLAFDKVKERAVDAHLWYKEKKFRSTEGSKLAGMSPSFPVYGA
ncbi:catalase [Colletotrichum graminicola]|uniref:Catalase n=1 Tax=Colletotrichum graminicola (strain M1.001 / M2 / FGSC 10212) TaxID=645133 RepID=E3QI46_COLGM|nr:catalase [Colletotrichum graminicola M1.001]EFQ30534.1 catalase [Colletotrichum graminicola M1.001]WDK22125.1 catalase [Colletotrichum graminicola]